jgi:hypothetical protein
MLIQDGHGLPFGPLATICRLPRSLCGIPIVEGDHFQVIFLVLLVSLCSFNCDCYFEYFLDVRISQLAKSNEAY